MTLFLNLLGTSVTMASESGPVIPVEDRIYIIDRSGSIDADMYRLELDLVNKFICGTHSLDPAVAPFGVSVILFDAFATLLVPYTVVTNTAQAAAICETLDMTTGTGGATALVPALDIAIGIFESEALAPSRHVIILTDGNFQNFNIAILRAETLRTMDVPVRICAMDFSSDCNFDGAGSRLANTIESPNHEPLEPSGLYSCTHGMIEANLLCDDCTCGTDCNANGILDTTDILDGTSQDQNGDLLPDECGDCDDNGIYDDVEVAIGLAFDCNVNDIPDSCDIGATSFDCDGNTIPDECELADGTALDCNLNGILDHCELSNSNQLFFSPQLSPIGLGSPVSQTFIAPPPAVGDVLIEFQAIADLNGQFKYLNVSVNGDGYGRLFNDFSTQTCPPEPDADQLIIPMAEFNALLGSGDLTVDLVADGPLPFDCDLTPPWVSMTMSYQAGPISQDKNNNGQPDVCDLAQGDNNLDGVINVDDLLSLLAKWGLCTEPCPADTNLDGAVDVEDLLTLLANWS
ncbi:MAG: hypothetical protein O7G85_03760 [Planctomycetota bacterium]|nr:hypothetical protein [Planctomycetota bacterium]